MESHSSNRQKVTKMSDIRALQKADIPAVAGLFQRIFRDPKRPVAPALAPLSSASLP
jgi:hypothetical protein